MRVKAIICPQCGATLPVSEGDTFAVCPHCGSRCAIEYGPGEQAGPVPMRFQDLGSGLVAFTATVPQGWTCQAAIQPNNVMDNWVTVTGAATSANGYEKLLFESMCTYRAIKDDPLRRGWDEPHYSAQDKRLFWRYHTAEQYADEVAAQVAGPGTALINRTALPGRLGTQWTSPQTYQQVWQAEQQAVSQGNAMAGGGMVWELHNLEMTAALSLYRAASQAGDRGILVATTCKATDMTLTETWGQMLYRGGMGGGLGSALGGFGGMGGGLGGFGGMGGGLGGFGGLIGGMLGQMGPQPSQGMPYGQAGQQAQMGIGTTPYIEWKPSYYVLLTEWPVATRSFEVFSAFVDSLELDPSVMQVAQYYASQYEGQLAEMVRANDERWERVSQFARQQSADLDRWRSDNWSRMQEHDRQMADIRTRSQTPSAFGGGETVDERVQRLRHESMMGVNTYEREDGTDYEFSTQAERVFESDYDPRLHVGTEGYHDDSVPDGWTELNRRF